jgi:hypothetical protein
MTTIELMNDLLEKVNGMVSRFPYQRTYISTLGGESKASILVTIGLEKKEDWSNGIFENSRYVRYHIHRVPKGIELECFQFHLKNKEMKKFRTIRSTPENIIARFEKDLKVLDSVV